MKKILCIFVVLITLTISIFGNGIVMTDAENGYNLDLISSTIEVNIEDQIAITKTTQVFKNNSEKSVDLIYAFPMPSDASAIQLRWYIDELWYLANISSTDNSGGSGVPSNMASKFKQYLGDTPIAFPIEQELDADGEIIVELQYVSLLSYSAGNVTYDYPNNYDLIQNTKLSELQFNVSLTSQRQIESLDILSHNYTTYENNGYSAYISYQDTICKASKDFEIEYSLSLDELGLFGISTFLPEDDVPDSSANRGFMAFIAEPDPDNSSEVIQKVFTLIIDCSGSMSGTKMEEAKNAASFIVNNLNASDYFNICNFSTYVNFFKESHVEYNAASQNEALNYIDTLEAGGWTNISSALTSSISQFSNASENTANIIIFLTDGEPTQGIQITQDILDEVDKYINDLNAPVSLYCFGIGNSINEQLLSLLATSNSGAVDYLGDDEIEEKLTEFYSIIKSPVLLNTELSFQPDVIKDVHPTALPNLFQGQQMLVVGRYPEPGTIGITLDGEAFQQDISYQYSLALSDSGDVTKQFLPKIWAKLAIEDLIVEYNNYEEDSEEAEAIKKEVINISENFGVVSPFTEFSGGDPQTGIDEDPINNNSVAQDFHLLGNYPNPFNPTTSIQFHVDRAIVKVAHIRIYNALGQLVKTLAIQINGTGKYSVFWDGTLNNGVVAPTGSYIYVIELNNTILSGKMTLMK